MRKVEMVEMSKSICHFSAASPVLVVCVWNLGVILCDYCCWSGQSRNFDFAHFYQIYWFTKMLWTIWPIQLTRRHISIMDKTVRVLSVTQEKFRQGENVVSVGWFSMFVFNFCYRVLYSQQRRARWAALCNDMLMTVKHLASFTTWCFFVANCVWECENSFFFHLDMDEMEKNIFNQFDNCSHCVVWCGEIINCLLRTDTLNFALRPFTDSCTDVLLCMFVVDLRKLSNYRQRIQKSFAGPCHIWWNTCDLFICRITMGTRIILRFDHRIHLPDKRWLPTGVIDGGNRIPMPIQISLNVWPSCLLLLSMQQFTIV